jgi:hypothetical protein
MPQVGATARGGGCSGCHGSMITAACGERKHCGDAEGHGGTRPEKAAPQGSRGGSRALCGWPWPRGRRPSVGGVSPAEPDQRERLARANRVEPSSWWPFVAAILGVLGCYGVLVVHLMLEATKAGAWGLAWLVVPSVFFCASAGAFFVGSGIPVRERLGAVRAALLGYTPRERPDRQPSPSHASVDDP